jgi:general secretion pathway protein D
MKIQPVVKAVILVSVLVGMLHGCASMPPGHQGSVEVAAARSIEAGVAKAQVGALGRSINEQNIWLSRRWIEIDQALDNNDTSRASELIDQLALVDSSNPRLKGAKLSLQSKLQQIKLDEAKREYAKQQPTQASISAPMNAEVDIAIGKKLPVLEFRDAPLRAVMETLGRLGALNFIFDKDVRTDTRVSISFKEASIKEVLRAILITQQLDFKALNSNSVVIFPNSAQKIRDYVDLQSRSFFLDNIDVKQAQVLIRTLVKTRDIFIDEKLNLLVMKDSPAAIRYAEQLLESVDQAEPEVVLDVQVLEVSATKTREIGLRLPSTAQLGLPAAAGTATELTRGTWAQQIVSVASPSISASLKASLGDANILSNPSIRVKNREKARIHIGEKLPVFTSIFNSTGVAGGAGNAFSTQVTLLEVGLKLDVEPLIHMSKDVEIKLALEVSNVLEKVSGPAQSVAYRVGTRNAVTNLRLRDGETQILAGLIRDDERRSANGVPGLFELPVLGRLFGQHTEEKDKTEIILLITPRVVRHINAPLIAQGPLVAGTEGAVGAAPLRMSDRASIAFSSVAATGTRILPGRPSPSASTTEPPPSASPELKGPATLSLKLEGPSSVKSGAEFEVSLVRTAGLPLFDAVVEVSLKGEGASFADGTTGTTLIGFASAQTTLRVKAGAAGSDIQILVTGAKGAAGDLALDSGPHQIQMKVAP